jgi:hypothetical protein
LAAAGVTDVNGRQVSLSISSPNVRYFHDADRKAAEGVAATLSEALGGVAVETRSFTDFRPLPEAGHVEVWLAGDAPPALQRMAGAPARSMAAQRREAQRTLERDRLTQSIEARLRQRLR